MGRPDIAIEKLEQGIIYSKENLDFIRLYMRLLLDRMEDAKITAVGEKLLTGGKGVEVENPQVRRVHRHVALLGLRHARQLQKVRGIP